MNSTNEIIDALNDVYGKDTFKFTWAIEKNPMRLIDKIIIRVSYKNNILFQTENLIKGEISSEEVLEPIIKEFNKQLMLNILFSIKTDGKIIDPNTGLPYLTFADVKQQLTTSNKDYESRGNNKTRETEGRVLRTNNGADDGTEGIDTNRLPKSGSLWN